MKRSTPTTANDNVAFGDDAIYWNTSGANNIAVGNFALVNNTRASDNTATGFASLKYDTSGGSNTGPRMGRAQQRYREQQHCYRLCRR